MRRSTLRASALVVALAAACVGTRAAAPRPPDRVVTVGALAVMSSHPHGPDADELTRSPGNAWATGVMWAPGGRHPVWRGCQHVYDPALSSLLSGA